MELLLDVNTFGITETSLIRLRNELARRIDNHVEIHKIDTNVCCCGFLLLDFTKDEAVWTGDGFRTDGGGEGGVGYNTAMALLEIFGDSPYDMDLGLGAFQTGEEAEVKEKLELHLKEYLVEGNPPPEKLADRKPRYLRGGRI